MTRWCKRGRHDICQRETEDETGLLVFDCSCECHQRNQDPPEDDLIDSAYDARDR